MHVFVSFPHPPTHSRDIHFTIYDPSLSALNVSKTFDFIACEKDVLWLLSPTKIAELRHILRFCVFENLDFMLLTRLIFKSEHFEFYLVLRVLWNLSSSRWMHVHADI